jgi:hypothetical protein
VRGVANQAKAHHYIIKTLKKEGTILIITDNRLPCIARAVT